MGFQSHWIQSQSLWDFKGKNIDSIGELGYVKFLGVAITTFVGATLFYIILARDFKSFGRPTPLRLCPAWLEAMWKAGSQNFFLKSVQITYINSFNRKSINIISLCDTCFLSFAVMFHHFVCKMIRLCDKFNNSWIMFKVILYESPK